MIYSILFFLSGFAGLLYQIVWVRLAFSHFGIITPVLSTVVSVFMLGLGLGFSLAGSWAGSRAARQDIPWLKAYGLVEFCIGISAAFVPWLFRAGDTCLLGMGSMDSGRYLIFSALVLAAAILPSCLLMGMTFPLMMAHGRQRSSSSETSFSFLYRANVFGAFCGALLTSLVFIELLGFRRTNLLGVAANLSIAGLCFWISRGRRRGPAFEMPPAHKTLHKKNAIAGPLWLAALFLTGFISMAYEVLWTRAFTRVLGTTIYAFATILAVYLAATWAGSCIYRRDLTRGKSLRLPFLYGLLAVAALFPVLLNDPRWGFGAAGVAVSLAPFCALLGYVTSALVDAYALGQPHEAGQAYFANIAGCVAGPLAASYVILPSAGARIGMLALSLPLLVLAVFAADKKEVRWPVAGTLAGLFFMAFLMGMRCQSFEEVCLAHDEHPVVRRDYVATVVSCGKGFDRRLMVNGIGITVLTPLTKAMAHLPVYCHRGKPQTALVICFGMGTTYRSLLSWGLKTTAVELVPSVRDAFGYYFDDADKVMQNPLGRVVIDDGRRYLQRTSDTFDIITLDPPPPVEAAGSGLLYSNEFYDVVKRRLNPNGILQQWWPGGERKILQAVAQSLRTSFRYVRVYKGVSGMGYHFLASQQEMTQPTVEQCIRRMTPGARQDLLEWNPGWTLAPLVGPFIQAEIPIERLLAAGDSTEITDDRPMNEYYLLRRWIDRRSGRYAEAF